MIIKNIKVCEKGFVDFPPNIFEFQFFNKCSLNLLVRIPILDFLCFVTYGCVILVSVKNEGTKV